ncbi:TonB-dependent receptor plug domain-containing protein [Pseudomonas sp. 5P_3.1_Bac2]|uniref:TonB-dependent receptor plug domain-containing protein n=1 Tax=Pseudomonas sp. 5P_3.1_Bac2 TaxID=2971617 RepID=UPI0021C78238|nr:TonB-dependent receptor [Pseudomonas sp. 5P_3.1_Bac2]MCU1716850.1 TonB-dependent receptor [Pseudomonas sp. 5P_3.1_Bac2]
MNSQLRRTPVPDLIRLSLSAGLVTLSAHSFADTDGPSGYSDKPLETVVVTGNRARGTQRTITDSPAPIDVIKGEELQRQTSAGLTAALNSLLPSFNLPAIPGGGSSSMVRPAGLRGLNADQTLVLVNGKRRHTTALVNISSYMNNGSQPADLDLIPVSAVDHIEVLRDGAAAQYGSDAIAGVINIILKNADQGGNSTTTLGHNYGSGGAVTTQALNLGTALPNSGFINFALDVRSQNKANRADKALGDFYNPLPDGSPDPRESTVSRDISWSYGQPRYELLNASYNAELPLDDVTSLYSFSTFSIRKSEAGASYVRPNSLSGNSSRYPDGYLPIREIEEHDWQTAVGARGEINAWAWDLSSTYGRNKAWLSSRNDFNPSFGDASGTNFDQGSQTAEQLTSNLDFTRSFDIGLAKPLDVSFGVEHRYEKFSIGAGDEDSYASGGYVIPTGPYAGIAPPAGSTASSGFRPEEANSDSRNNYAGYLDLGFNPTAKWYVGVAGRLEHYDDDAGDSASGKLSTRYELTPQFSLRATVSNGFRAPSIAQSIYASSWTRTLVTGPGTSTSYDVKVLPVDSPAAKALGAEALKPEKSLNYSVGFTYEPLANLRLTTDAYLIKITDRIVEASVLSGPAVSDILAANGLQSDIAAQFYTNAIDTRTHGVDVVLDYLQNYGKFGSVKWSAGLNWNKTKVTDVKDTPAALAALGSSYTLFDYEAQSDLSKGSPTSKFVLSGNWQVGDFTVNLRGTRYGEYFQASAGGRAYDRTWSPTWITDLDIDYAITSQLKVAIGANNLFDKYPDKIGPITGQGVNGYGLYSPYGLTGGYYYSRLSLDF